jgi:transcriptional regulator of acetoin/glycerol metabolism
MSKVYNDTVYGKLKTDAERAIIVKALAEHGGNVSSACRYFGIDRAQLYKRMRTLGIVTPSKS